MCLGPGTEIQVTGNLFRRKIGPPICWDFFNDLLGFLRRFVGISSPICWDFFADLGAGLCGCLFQLSWHYAQQPQGNNSNQPKAHGKGKKGLRGGGGGGGFEPSEGGGGSRKGARRSGPFMKQKFGYFLPSELKKIPDLTPDGPYGV